MFKKIRFLRKCPIWSHVKLCSAVLKIVSEMHTGQLRWPPKTITAYLKFHGQFYFGCMTYGRVWYGPVNNH